MGRFARALCPSSLLKKPCIVIARSDLCDAAISKYLIFLTTSLLRFARKDSKKTFSAACYEYAPDGPPPPLPKGGLRPTRASSIVSSSSVWFNMGAFRKARFDPVPRM